VATIVEEIRWLSLITLAVTTIWISSVYYISGKYRRVAEGQESV
jgi:hypothetical protein